MLMLNMFFYNLWWHIFVLLMLNMFVFVLEMFNRYLGFRFPVIK
jgi:hypothetical protein